MFRGSEAPVALQYTILAFGSLFWSWSTVRPVLLGLLAPVGTRFLALWHSSNTIWCKCHKVKALTFPHSSLAGAYVIIIPL